MNLRALAAQICDTLKEETGLDLTDEQGWVIECVLFDALEGPRESFEDVNYGELEEDWGIMIDREGTVGLLNDLEKYIRAVRSFHVDKYTDHEWDLLNRIREARKWLTVGRD